MSAALPPSRSASSPPISSFSYIPRRAFLRTALLLLVVLASLTPIAFVASYIWQEGVNVPFWDEWDASVPVAIKTAEGTLTLRDLLSQHVQQRIFFTKLTTAILTVLTGWDLCGEMWVSFGLTTVNLLLLIALFRTNTGPPAVLIAIPFAALTFSYRQRQNWLMGFQTAWFFMLMFLLLAVLLLRRSGRLKDPPDASWILLVCRPPGGFPARECTRGKSAEAQPAGRDEPAGVPTRESATEGCIPGGPVRRHARGV